MKQENKKQKVKFPIGMKLVTLFTVLVVLVLGLSTAIVVYMVSRDSKIKAEDSNNTLNVVTSEAVQSIIIANQNNTLGFLNELVLSRNKNIEKEMFEDFCVRNNDILFVQSPVTGLITSPKAELDKPGCSKDFDAFLKTNSFKIGQARNGLVEVVNMSNVLEQPALCVIFPYEVNGKKSYAAVGFNAAKVVDLMTNSGMNTSFLMGRDGRILLSSNNESSEGSGYVDVASYVISNANFDESQVLAKDDEGYAWYVAYKKLAGGMYSVTVISEYKVLQAIRHTAYEISLLSLAILFLSIMMIRYFSKTLTNPILDLADAAEKIGAGNFEVTLEAKTKDEIGLLTENFVAMSNGLGNFMRFTNKTLVEQAMKGKLGLGGKRKDVTIFFSDIRSFTAMSEKMTPNEVVEFLNEYMTAMERCVERTHGVVDKYIGDAVMAVWGSPETAGSTASDAWNAVNAALMMRSELYKLNNKRAKEGKGKIQIGCGINTGSVVAGQIGSNHRMEYTVIGDAVNLASRTEALNKPFQTDILITENTYKLIGDRLVVEEMPSVHVKGKEDAIKMFAVINTKDVLLNDGKGPENLKQVRKLMGFHEIDKSQVNTDEEEKKYKIGK